MTNSNSVSAYVASGSGSDSVEGNPELPKEMWDNEKAIIRDRRKNMADIGADPKKIEDSLIGLALSGGGIRSACFSLGVMQALAKHKLMRHVDILSTVSGGGYIGSSLTWWTKIRKSFPFGTDDAHEKELPPILAYMRNRGNYLTPEKKWWTILPVLSVLLRGMFLNLAVWLPLVAALFLASIMILGEEWPAKYADEIIWWATIIAVSFFALFAIGSLVYSFATYPSHRYDRYFLRRYFEKFAGWVTVFFIISGLIALLPKFVEAIEISPKISDILEMGGPGYIILGFVVGFYGFQKSSSSSMGGLISKISLGLALLLVVCGLIVTPYQFADWIYDHRNDSSLFVIGPYAISLHSLGFAALIAVSILSGLLVNVNYISLHRFYRDRLMEAFMPDEKFVKGEGSFHCPASESNKALLSSFGNALDAPYHILNTNLILVNSKVEPYKTRNGDNFILSPLYCGGTATGWRATKSFMGDRLTLATSMAVSGAAANPNAFVAGAGLTINPVVGFLMALLNIRLGNWVPNPKKKWMQKLKPNHFWPGLYELLKLVNGSGYNENRNFLEITDGGHFENLAFYELIRRRARLIICCDGGADENFHFSDLLNAVNRVEDDFGAKVNISTAALAPFIPRIPGTFPTGVRLAQQGYGEFDIAYADGSTGKLILLKTTLVSGLHYKTLQYKGEHAAFPDESTADQFFSPEQFDAYRDVGLRIGEDMITETNLSDQIAKL